MEKVRKKWKKQVIIVLSLVLALSSVLGISDRSNYVKAADIIDLSNLPSYPIDGQSYWVIFNEGFRNDRIEMTTCDINPNTDAAYICWDSSLDLKNANVVGEYNQYCLNDKGEWEKIGSYSRFTDYATNVIASNLNVYNSSGDLIIPKSNLYKTNVASGENNYIFNYEGKKYISSAYNDFVDNNQWTTLEETVIKSGNFNWVNAITSAISVNDGSALDNNAWKESNFFTDPNNNSAISAMDVGGTIISMVNGFVTGGRAGVTDIKLQLQSNGSRNRMLLLYGSPIETYYAGKTLWLHEILTNAHSGEAAYFLWAKEDEDALIRKCFKGLKSDGKYSMKITFSNQNDYLDSPYKYTVIIGDDGKVYQYPILHNGTKMEIYHKADGQNVTYEFDATQLVNSEKIEVDDQVGKDIIKFLDNKSWQVKAVNQTIKVKDKITKKLGDAKFSLNAKAKTAITYKSSDSKIVSVDKKGKVTVKAIGSAKITITAVGTNKYKKVQKQVTITVIPKGTSISKLKPYNTKISVSWKKHKQAISGYQIQCSTDKKFKSGCKTLVIKSKNSTSKMVKNLKNKKKYYFRIRVYKTVDKKKYYSNWSKVRSKKTK